MTPSVEVNFLSFSAVPLMSNFNFPLVDSLLANTAFVLKGHLTFAVILMSNFNFPLVDSLLANTAFVLEGHLTFAVILMSNFNFPLVDSLLANTAFVLKGHLTFAVPFMSSDSPRVGWVPQFRFCETSVQNFLSFFKCLLY